MIPRVFTFLAATLIPTLPLAAAEPCFEVTKQVSFCQTGTNLSGQGAMETAFPNSKLILLDEADWHYGVSIALIPVKTTPGTPPQVEDLANVLIRNATQNLWVDPVISDLRFRGATLGDWPGVQAEYRISSSPTATGTSYVVDAYLTSPRQMLAVQSYSDAAKKVTPELRKYHGKTMGKLQVIQ